MKMIDHLRSRARDRAEEALWAVRDWSDAHPPKTHQLIRLLDPDERLDFAFSEERKTVRDHASRDAAVAAWLTRHGRADRIPAEYRSGDL